MVRLGDLINPDHQIDIFDPNLKQDFKSKRQNQLKHVLFLSKSSKSIYLNQKEMEIVQK